MARLAPIVLIGSLAVLSGCHRALRTPSATQELPIQEVRLHQVNYPHENLSMIALWYTGDAKNWTQLSDYNGHLRSPSALSAGDIIRIPSQLMIRLDPMTAEFVAEQHSKIRRFRERAPTAVEPSSAVSTDLEQESQQDPRETSDPTATPLPTDGTRVDSETSNDPSQDRLIENLLSE